MYYYRSSWWTLEWPKGAVHGWRKLVREYPTLHRKWVRRRGERGTAWREQLMSGRWECCSTACLLATSPGSWLDILTPSTGSSCSGIDTGEGVLAFSHWELLVANASVNISANQNMRNSTRDCYWSCFESRCFVIIASCLKWTTSITCLIFSILIGCVEIRTKCYKLIVHWSIFKPMV